MDDRKTIFHYLGQVLIIFGFTMILILCITVLFGERAEDYSSFFPLGQSGVSVKIMAQFLLLSVLNVLLQYLFNTDRFIKNLSRLKRTMYMVLAILTVIIIFIVLFRWFPINMWQPWCMFFVGFFICFGFATLITIFENNMENRKLEEGLEKLKKEWEQENEKNE